MKRDGWPELTACLEDGETRRQRNAARQLIGRLNAQGRYREALRKARIKWRRDCKRLPYTPCLGEYEADALMDAIEKAFRDGGATS